MLSRGIPSTRRLRVVEILNKSDTNICAQGLAAAAVYSVAVHIGWDTESRDERVTNPRNENRLCSLGLYIWARSKYFIWQIVTWKFFSKCDKTTRHFVINTHSNLRLKKNLRPFFVELNCILGQINDSRMNKQASQFYPEPEGDALRSPWRRKTDE